MAADQGETAGAAGTAGAEGPASAPERPASAPVAAVELRGVTKRYGELVACESVDLALHRGEIHGILGENGAGKSTLMRMLIGLVTPDSGTIDVDGVPRRIPDPQAAAALGIGMVHQHFSLVEELRVWENVALGDSGRLDRAAARRQVLDIGRRYGIDVDPDAVVGGLSAGLRQRVEIIKCLRRDPRILVFDEPTSVLTPAESEQLFGVLRRVVRDEQRAVALVSHKLEEILHATDQVTIMRRGAVVSTTTTAGATAASLAKAMVGRDVSLRAQSAALGLVSEADRVAHTEATGHEIGAPVLTVRGAMVSGRGGRRLLDGLDLQVHAGEVVGVAGVEGNGQRELADLLSSLLTLDAGTILIDGEPVSERAAGALLAAGVGVVPEDRHDSGCALALSVAENLFLSAPEQPAGRWLLRRSAMRRMADELIAEYRIDCSGPDAAMWSLSGGNQQRLVLARELSRRPKVLVAAQPTRGLDVGGIEYVTGKLRSAADTGVGVLLLSTEIEEILTLADRVLVIHRGRIVGEMARAEVDLEQLGILMGGAAP